MFNLKTAVEHGRVCRFQGAGQGAATRNSYSIPRSCNAVMHLEICAICRVAVSHQIGVINKLEKYFRTQYLPYFEAVNCGI